MIHQRITLHINLTFLYLLHSDTSVQYISLSLIEMNDYENTLT